MIEKCPRQTELERHFLTDGTPEELPDGEKAHFDGCRVCQGIWESFRKFESGMQSRVQESLRKIHPPSLEPPQRERFPGQDPLPDWFSFGRLVGALSFVMIGFMVFTFLARSKPTPSGRTPGTSLYVSRATVLEGFFLLGKDMKLSPGTTFDLTGENLSSLGKAGLHLPNDIDISASDAGFHFSDAGIVIGSGKIEVSVNRKGTAFSVRTPSVTLGVLGTRFLVDVRETGETRVEVFSGRVEARSVSKGTSKILGAGEILSVPPTGDLTPVSSALVPPDASGPFGVSASSGAAVTTPIPTVSPSPVFPVPPENGHDSGNPPPDGGGSDGIFGKN